MAGRQRRPQGSLVEGRGCVAVWCSETSGTAGGRSRSSLRLTCVCEGGAGCLLCCPLCILGCASQPGAVQLRATANNTSAVSGGQRPEPVSGEPRSLVPAVFRARRRARARRARGLSARFCLRGAVASGRLRPLRLMALGPALLWEAVARRRPRPLGLMARKPALMAESCFFTAWVRSTQPSVPETTGGLRSHVLSRSATCSLIVSRTAPSVAAASSLCSRCVCVLMVWAGGGCG